jgi:hypothetical protein
MMIGSAGVNGIWRTPGGHSRWILCNYRRAHDVIDKSFSGRTAQCSRRAATAGAIMLFAATYLGIPVSTTHTVTGSVIGVGAARKVSAVRWNVATNIVIAWIITLPAAALMAAIFYVLSGFAL